MKTDTLIDWLAREAGPAPRGLALRRLSLAMAVGVVCSMVAALVVMGLVPLNVRADTGWWMKVFYSASIALVAAWWLSREAKPAMRSGAAPWTTVAVWVVMVLIALASVASMSAPERLGAWLGHSWKICPLNILMLSLPALAMTFWALRGLAPTRPRRAGGVAGALAGALGATGYSLGCIEVEPMFVATWYTMGIVLTALVGAWLGPRVLRW